jgi:hypothetical protein
MIKQSLFLLFALIMSFTYTHAQSNTDLLPDKQTNITELQTEYKLNGVFNITTLGVLSGSSQNRQSAPFSFQSLMMYQLDHNIALGIGMGIEFLEETYLPIVGDFRYYLRGSRFSPFVFVQSGYSLPTDKTANGNIVYDYYSIWPGYYPQYEEVQPLGGFMINPGFGIRHLFHADFGMEISFSYRHQNLNYDAPTNTRIEADYNRLNIRIGIIFQ